VINQLDPAQMSGTVMAVTDVARPAIEGMQRRWPNFGRGNDLIDMNREWPGNETVSPRPVDTRGSYSTGCGKLESIFRTRRGGDNA
jgi:predicted deacylase